MKEMQGFFQPIVRMSIFFILICGLVYPLVGTGIAQIIMPDQANGSLIYNNKNEIIGSKLIGQNFIGLKYFHGRVSSIDYNSAKSGSDNYAPSNPKIMERVKNSILKLKEKDPTIRENEIPIDLVTNSGSGLDPDISPKAAYIQINRISNETGIGKAILRKLIRENIEGRELGIFGEERVNVLKLNLDLKKLLK